MSQNTVSIMYAEDTEEGRSAGYLVIGLMNEAGVGRTITAYGKIGSVTNIKDNGTYTPMSATQLRRDVDTAMAKKTKKNYVVKDTIDGRPDELGRLLSSIGCSKLFTSGRIAHLMDDTFGFGWQSGSSKTPEPSPPPIVEDDLDLATLPDGWGEF